MDGWWVWWMCRSGLNPNSSGLTMLPQRLTWWYPVAQMLLLLSCFFDFPGFTSVCGQSRGMRGGCQAVSPDAQWRTVQRGDASSWALLHPSTLQQKKFREVSDFPLFSDRVSYVKLQLGQGEVCHLCGLWSNVHVWIELLPQRWAASSLWLMKRICSVIQVWHNSTPRLLMPACYLVSVNTVEHADSRATRIHICFQLLF